MRVVGQYSFNKGQHVLEEKYPDELREIYEVIASIDASVHKTKVSEEKTSRGQVFYSPKGLNKAFKAQFHRIGWHSHRVSCDYPPHYYVPDYQPPHITGRGAFREMDFIKHRIGVEVQFGKYAFMVYNVAAKMTIFHKMGLIEAGVEIVPVKELQAEMSSGVSYFEQLVWDLEKRGVADIDIPVLILGVTTTVQEEHEPPHRQVSQDEFLRELADLATDPDVEE